VQDIGDIQIHGTNHDLGWVAQAKTNTVDPVAAVDGTFRDERAKCIRTQSYNLTSFRIALLRPGSRSLLAASIVVSACRTTLLALAKCRPVVGANADATPLDAANSAIRRSDFVVVMVLQLLYICYFENWNCSAQVVPVLSMLG